MMRKIFISLLFTVFIIASSFAKHQPAYRIYTKNGNRVSPEKIIRSMNKAEILMFGEIHNNPIAHWMQIEITKSIHQKHMVILGTEMIETDNQQVINQYLNKEINATALDTLARLPSNYKTDYKPLVDFARDHSLQFICTNIPRKYANQVYKQGLESLESLPENIKQWIAPLPIAYDSTLASYQNMLTMMRGRGHNGSNFPKAQAIKDATMAHFILQNLEDNHKFIHYHGTYHSDNYEGIVWYLKHNKPGLKIVTISTVYQSNVNRLEDDNKGKADFILVVDEDMTTTY